MCGGGGLILKILTSTKKNIYKNLENATVGGGVIACLLYVIHVWVKWIKDPLHVFQTYNVYEFSSDFYWTKVYRQQEDKAWSARRMVDSGESNSSQFYRYYRYHQTRSKTQQNWNNYVILFMNKNHYNLFDLFILKFSFLNINAFNGVNWWFVYR